MLSCWKKIRCMITIQETNHPHTRLLHPTPDHSSHSLHHPPIIRDSQHLTVHYPHPTVHIAPQPPPAPHSPQSTAPDLQLAAPAVSPQVISSANAGAGCRWAAGGPAPAPAPAPAHARHRRPAGRAPAAVYLPAPPSIWTATREIFEFTLNCADYCVPTGALTPVCAVSRPGSPRARVIPITPACHTHPAPTRH